MTHREGAHIENLEVTEASLIQSAIEQDKKMRERHPEADRDVILAASLCACGKRFGPDVAKEYAKKMFPRE